MKSEDVITLTSNGFQDTMIQREIFNENRESGELARQSSLLRV